MSEDTICFNFHIWKTTRESVPFTEGLQIRKGIQRLAARTYRDWCEVALQKFLETSVNGNGATEGDVFYVREINSTGTEAFEIHEVETVHSYYLGESGTKGGSCNP